MPGGTAVIYVTNDSERVVTNTVISNVLMPEVHWELATISNIRIYGLWKEKDSIEALDSLNQELFNYNQRVSEKLGSHYLIFQPGEVQLETNRSLLRFVSSGCQVVLKYNPDKEKLISYHSMIVGNACSNENGFVKTSAVAWQSMMDAAGRTSGRWSQAVMAPQSVDETASKSTSNRMFQYRMNVSCYLLVHSASVVYKTSEILRGQYSRADPQVMAVDPASELNGALSIFNNAFQQWSIDKRKNSRAVGTGIDDFTYQTDTNGTCCQADVVAVELVE
jgi:hypothetical protein